MYRISPSRRLLGAVLAGGRSRRFGTDKAEARLGSLPLLDHAVNALATHVGQVVICGREAAGLVSLADEPTAGIGPLGGLCAALRYGAEHDFTAVMTTGCDMPFFPAQLAAALPGDGPSVLAGQRLAGYWPTSLAGELATYLASTRDFSWRGWQAQSRARVIALPELVMPNINTPADLLAVEQARVTQCGSARTS